MRRWGGKQSFFDRLTMVAGTLALAGMGVLLLTQLRTLRRYINIRRMSAQKHPRPPGTLRQGADAPPRWGTMHWPVH
jgi:hypothetical protein